MAKSPAAPKTPETIRETLLDEALGQRYLAYALSTIVSRSLPDVRDGLKPVHRRLLYAMRQLKLDPAGGFKKCARVVGDVIGKYHPHGDTSVYDAMVRLAQEFAVRYPLVEGQGNFGNIDGDNAAAMRYTEAKLTPFAQALMDGLDDDAVDLRPTYDGEESEPVVMPAAVPNLLANGASGIAVGMATNIPPHNVGELCDALLHLIKTPKAQIATLVEMIPGPDFPTGGVLVENRETIVEAYKTGRGSFRLRARWKEEKLDRGQYQIILTEIPYQVQKAKLIERIAALMDEKKLPFLADIRDESTEEVRVVLEPKSRTVDATQLMEQLFRQTDLEIRFGLNMNVLDADGIPKVMDLRGVLQAYLDHRQVVLVRRSKHRLAEIVHRLEILEGYLIAYLNLDEVIHIIRTEDEPKPKLMKKFSLTDTQAEAILNMRLRSLRKLEEMEIKGEHKKLSDEKKELTGLLKDDDKQWKAIADQVKLAREKFGQKTPLGKRRTELADAPKVELAPIESLVEKEPVTVILSAKGWIRAVKGHKDDVVAGGADLKFKEGDAFLAAVKAQTTDKVLMFGSDGRFYTIAADRLPAGRGFGEPIRLHFELPNDADILGMWVYAGAQKFLVVSSAGRGFVVPAEQVFAQTKNGKQCLNLAEGEKAVVCTPIPGTAGTGDDLLAGKPADSVAIIGENRKLLIFPLSDVPEMGRGRGVILQKYKDGGTADAKVFNYKEGLTWKSGGRERTETDLKDWKGERAQAGRLPPKGFSREDKPFN
ncbi:MAG: DNA topoisomerase IV subunit A [Rhodospirillaceae bacterium]|nr:DNA topoisomerase IV subunit A [Rhodospirillaceae bacterium]